MDIYNLIAYDEHGIACTDTSCETYEEALKEAQILLRDFPEAVSVNIEAPITVITKETNYTIKHYEYK